MHYELMQVTRLLLCCDLTAATEPTVLRMQRNCLIRNDLIYMIAAAWSSASHVSASNISLNFNAYRTPSWRLCSWTCWSCGSFIYLHWTTFPVQLH